MCWNGREQLRVKLLSDEWFLFLSLFFVFFWSVGEYSSGLKQSKKNSGKPYWSNPQDEWTAHAFPEVICSVILKSCFIKGCSTLLTFFLQFPLMLRLGIIGGYVYKIASCTWCCYPSTSSHIAYSDFSLM